MTFAMGDCGVCGAPASQPCSAECDGDEKPDGQVKWRWCLDCRRELSDALDACYSADTADTMRCRGCRDRLAP